MHYHFEGNLTARDGKRHIPHQFVAPANGQAIEIRLRFAPHTVHGMANMLTLTVFDPDEFRGAGHRHGADHQARIGPTAATPGYVPGSLPAGPWIVQIDTHMIMPGRRYTTPWISRSPRGPASGANGHACSRLASRRSVAPAGIAATCTATRTIPTPASVLWPSYSRPRATTGSTLSF